MKLGLNQKEAAKALGISEPTFVRRVRPHLRYKEVGTRMIFPVSELQRWLDGTDRSL